MPRSLTLYVLCLPRADVNVMVYMLKRARINTRSFDVFCYLFSHFALMHIAATALETVVEASVYITPLHVSATEQPEYRRLPNMLGIPPLSDQHHCNPSGRLSRATAQMRCNVGAS